MQTRPLCNAPEKPGAKFRAIFHFTTLIVILCFICPGCASLDERLASPDPHIRDAAYSLVFKTACETKNPEEFAEMTSRIANQDDLAQVIYEQTHKIDIWGIDSLPDFSLKKVASKIQGRERIVALLREGCWPIVAAIDNQSMLVQIACGDFDSLARTAASASSIGASGDMATPIQRPRPLKTDKHKNEFRREERKRKAMRIALGKCSGEAVLFKIAKESSDEEIRNLAARKCENPTNLLTLAKVTSNVEVAESLLLKMPNRRAYNSFKTQKEESLAILNASSPEVLNRNEFEYTCLKFQISSNAKSPDVRTAAIKRYFASAPDCVLQFIINEIHLALLDKEWLLKGRVAMSSGQIIGLAEIISHDAWAFIATTVLSWTESNQIHYDSYSKNEILEWLISYCDDVGVLNQFATTPLSSESRKSLYGQTKQLLEDRLAILEQRETERRNATNLKRLMTIIERSDAQQDIMEFLKAENDYQLRSALIEIAKMDRSVEKDQSDESALDFRAFIGWIYDLDSNSKGIQDLSIAAIKRVDNPSLLADIAVNDENPQIRVAAVNRLDDKDALLDEISNDINEQVRDAALVRLRETQPAQITVQYVLKLHKTKTVSTDVLAKTLETFKDSPQLRRLIEDQTVDSKIRVAALGRVEEPEYLVKTAIRSNSSDLAKMSIGRIVDESALIQLANGDANVKSDDVRECAINRLKQLSSWVMMASKLNDLNEQKSALAKIRSDDDLVKVVNDKNTSPLVVLLAARRIKSPGLAKSIHDREAAAEREWRARLETALDNIQPKIGLARSHQVSKDEFESDFKSRVGSSELEVMGSMGMPLGIWSEKWKTRLEANLAELEGISKSIADLDIPDSEVFDSARRRASDLRLQLIPLRESQESLLVDVIEWKRIHRQALEMFGPSIL